MKKLYRVEITVMVMAESRQDAADLCGTLEVEIQPDDCQVFLATSTPEEWADCIPFGGDDDRTCEEIVVAARRTAAVQTAMALE